MSVLAALFFALLSGCGSDEDGTDGRAATAAEASVEKGDAAKAAAEKGDAPEATTAEEKPVREEPPMFAIPPNRHKDSGGGSKQFRQRGADNSIQDSGKEADPETFAEVAAIVHAFLDAQAAGNTEEVCKYLSGDLIGELLNLAKQSQEVPQTCAGVIDALTAKTDAKTKRMIAKADIGSVRVDGDHAFVLYRGAEKGVYVLPIVHQNDRWRIAALAGTLLP